MGNMPNMNFDQLPEKFEFQNGYDNQIYTAELSESETSYKITKRGDPSIIFTTWSAGHVESQIQMGLWEIVHSHDVKLPDHSHDVHKAMRLPPREDIINNPSHYHKNEIDVNGYLEKHFPLEGSYTVAEGFYIGNVIKYTSRYKDKNGLQDLEKAKFNLNKLLELEESK
jgi:hypothetical protein